MPVSARSIKLSISGKLFGIWVALATVLVPMSYLLSAVTQSRPADTELLLDPGPRHLCYQFSDLGKNGSNSSTSKRTSECSQVPDYSGCPTWQYSWFNGEQEQELISGGNGSLVNLTLVNNALGASRDLVEVSFDYLYPGCAIQKLPNSTQYNLLGFDGWIFEYDVTIRRQQKGRVGCRGKEAKSCNGTSVPEEASLGRAQKYLSTDFVYQWQDPDCSHRNASSCPLLNNTISVVHYYPLHPNLTEGPFRNADGYGVRLKQEPSLEEGASAHVVVDFKTLFQLYGRELCHGNKEPPWLHVHTMRIVSSNANASSTVEVQNMQASLRKGPDPLGYWKPQLRPGEIPVYCNWSNRTASTGRLKTRLFVA